MLGEVDDGDLTTRLEGAPGFFDRRLRTWHMMQDHAGDDGIHLAIGDGQMFEVSQPEVAAIDGSLAGRLPRQLQHGGGGVDGDDLVGPLQQGRQHQSRTSTQIQDTLEACRQHRQGQLSVCVTIRTETFACFTVVGQTVEEGECLPATALDRFFEALHVMLIGWQITFVIGQQRECILDQGPFTVSM